MRRLKRLDAINVAWLSGERAFQFANGLIVTAFLARELGPTAWGYLSAATAAAFLLAPVVTALQPLTLREVLRSADVAEKNRSLNTAVAVAAPLALLAALCAAVLFHLVAPSSTGPLLPALILTTATLLSKSR